MQEKKEIRQQYKEKRNSFHQAWVLENSRKLTERLLEWEVFQKASVIYFYYPLGNEVNLLGAAKEALQQGKIVGFPKTLKEEIVFYRVVSLEDFQEGKFHVMEPLSKEKLEIENPLVLTPGVAFDKEKRRIGYGGGYYDRFFHKMPFAIKVGIAYFEQLIEAMLVEEHDIEMDYIVNQNKIW